MSLSFSLQKKNDPIKKRKIAVMGFDDEEPDQKKSKQEIEEDKLAQSDALKNQGNSLAEQGKSLFWVCKIILKILQNQKNTTRP